MKYVSRIMLWLATAGLMVPQLGYAGVAEASSPEIAAAPQQVQIVDIALDGNHLLRGQLVDRQGIGKSDCQVRLLNGREVVGEAVTDHQGVFGVPVERGGMYTLSDGEASAMVRVWTQQAAPPSAKDSVLMVSDPELARGRLGRGGLDTLIGWAAILGVTAAVIWAVTDRKDGS
jgi:hypothetical protein